MKHEYSLAHLTAMALPPVDLIEVASKTGYDYVSLRLSRVTDAEPLYPIIHLEGEDIEVAFTHGNHYGEEYWSFVNGQHTTMGGTHLAAFREAFVETLRNHFKKDFDAADVRQSIDAAIVVRVQEPVFESQTKNKLGNTDIRTDLVNRVREELLQFFHRNKEIAEKLGISYETVHTYIRRIYEKLQVRTRTEAVAKFLRR